MKKTVVWRIRSQTFCAFAEIRHRPHEIDKYAAQPKPARQKPLKVKNSKYNQIWYYPKIETRQDDNLQLEDARIHHKLTVARRGKKTRFIRRHAHQSQEKCEEENGSLLRLQRHDKAGWQREAQNGFRPLWLRMAMVEIRIF
eukprot:Selendium_serpulae@DN6401_c1_g2_i5.p1